MKKLIILLSFLIVANFSFGQDWPITQNIGSSNTKVQVPGNGGFVASLINRNYLDTTAANLTPIRLYPGGQIFTTSDSSFWIRRYNQWVKQYAIVPSGGGGTPSDTVIWRVSGNGQTIINSLSGGGIGSANNVPVWLITNGNIRIQLPASGMNLSNDTTSNKVMTFNPSTKDWGYANWVGGGGSGGSGWSLTGNAGTTAGTNFIGTTDAVDFVIKTGIAPNQVMRFSGDGNYRTNIGLNNVLGGIHSLAVGNTDTATGNYSLAYGLNSKASGGVSFAFGSGSKAIESAAIAFSGGDAEGVGSFAHGGTATGEYAMAVGAGVASGDYSQSFGGTNLASGGYGFAAGNLDTASGAWSAVFGGESKASGNYSFAQGHESIASGVVSIAMGNGAVSTGYGATTFGKGYTNSKDTSFAFGVSRGRILELTPDSAIASPINVFYARTKKIEHAYSDSFYIWDYGRNEDRVLMDNEKSTFWGPGTQARINIYQDTVDLSVPSTSGKLLFNGIYLSSSVDDSMVVRDAAGKVGVRAIPSTSGIGLQNVITNDPVLTTSNTISLGSNSFIFSGNATSSSIEAVVGEYSFEASGGGRSSIFSMINDSISLKPGLGLLNIDTLNSSANATDSMMVWNKSNGNVGIRAIPSGSSGLTVGTTTVSSGTSRAILYSNTGILKDSSIFVFNTGGELQVGSSTDAGNYRLQVTGKSNFSDTLFTTHGRFAGMDVGVYGGGMGFQNDAALTGKSGLYFRTFSGGSTNGPIVFESGSFKAQMIVSDATQNQMQVVYGGNTGYFNVGSHTNIYSSSGQELRLGSAGNLNKLTLNTTGYFGINVTSPTSALHTTSFATGYAAKTTTYSIAATDHTIECTSGTFTVTLPTAASITGREYTIVNSGAGTITIATTSSQTFANINATPTTLTLAAVGAGAITSYTVKSNGANWLVTNKVKNE